MANSTVNTYGIVRGGVDIYHTPPGGEMQTNYNNRGDMLVSLSLPDRAELVRQGGSWSCQLKEANAFTLLITIPSTLATLCLQNCESQGGKSYVIDRVWTKCVTTTAAANYITTLAQLLPPGAAVVAHSANVTISSMSGKSAYTGKAQICAATILPAFVADKWQAVGTCLLLPTSTSIAAYGEAQLYGRYIVPPGGCFGVSAQEAVSGGTAIQGIEWHEVQLTLG